MGWQVRGLAGVRLLAGSALGIGALPAIALAHGVAIQARTSQAVEVRAVYDNEQPMVNAQVQVFAPDNPETAIITGTTDANGTFLFTPTMTGDWEVAVRQAGHGGITVIPITDSSTLATSFANPTGLTGLQRAIVAGAVAWGCIGTALYFRRERHFRRG